MPADIEIRPYRPGDEHGLAALFGRCFAYEIDVRHWLWKVHQPGRDYVNAWIALAGDDFVGQYVGAPIRAWVNGQDRRAIMVFDVMVDPRARRRGVLTSLGRRAHDEWSKCGVQYVIGLPNEQWGTRAGALGWRTLFPLRWLVWVLRPETILARRLNIDALEHSRLIGKIWRAAAGARVRIDDSLSIEELAAADSRLDEIHEAEQHTYGTVRGMDWAQWRYFSCPSTRYRTLMASRGDRPIGYVVYKIDSNHPIRAVVTEMHAIDDDQGVRNALMRALLERCLTAGAEIVSTLAVPATANYRAFRRSGFMPRKAEFTVQYVPLQQEMKHVTGTDQWDIMGGDFDVV